MKTKPNSYRRLYLSIVVISMMGSSCVRMADVQSGSQAIMETSTASEADSSNVTPRIPDIGTGLLSKQDLSTRNGSPTSEQLIQTEPTPVSTLMRTLTPITDETEYGEPPHRSASTPSPTGESISTIVPVPTLTNSEESELLSSLMLTNGGCELPCWWGIEPGVTTEQGASDLIQSYGLQWVISEDDFRIIHLGYPRDGGNLVSTTITTHLWIDDGIVKLIQVEGGYRREELRGAFEREWQAFSPAAIIDRFGPPRTCRV